MRARILSVGPTAACAISPQGTVMCWGQNSNLLEFGSAGMASTPTPATVPITGLSAISSGWGQHKCGLKATTAVCWGRGANGQLGDGTLGAVGNPPVTVVSSQDWMDISTGRLITCAVDSTHDAFCWGYSQRGEVGDTIVPETGRYLVPNRVVGGIKFASVAAGWIHSCGISTAGAAYCWGDNSSGQLGGGVTDTAAHRRPLLVTSSYTFTKIAVSARATCAVTTDGTLLCWGYNGTGQLGDGTNTTHTLPTPVGLTRKWKDVAMSSGFVEGTSGVFPAGLSQGGIAHACAIDDSGTAYCWGWNAAGQLGEGTTTDRLVPTPVMTSVKFTALALGGAYSCGVSTDGHIYCWGANLLGQLGNGAFTDALQPVKVLTGW